MFDITQLVLAFGSGIFGACIGAGAAFPFVGILVLLGVGLQATTGNADFLGTMAWGYWGPHVGGFAAGVAAAAYAAKKGKLEGGKALGKGLAGLGAPDVLLVGGIFGLIGYALNFLFAMPGAWTDTIALTVMASGMIARLAFGSTGLFGKVADGESRFMPSEAKAFIPFQRTIPQLLMIGGGVGIGAAVISIIMPEGAGPAFCFGFAALSLLLGLFGVTVPVTHHIALPAGLAAAASGSIIWGAVFGILGAIIGEITSNTFNTWGDTHIDPPAMAIWILTSLSILLTNAGIYGSIPLP